MIYHDLPWFTMIFLLKIKIVELLEGTMSGIARWVWPFNIPDRNGTMQVSLTVTMVSLII